MLAFIKKLFCKHNWVCYGEDYEDSTGKFFWVIRCLLCCKVKVIYGDN